MHLSEVEIFHVKSVPVLSQSILDREMLKTSTNFCYSCIGYLLKDIYIGGHFWICYFKQEWGTPKKFQVFSTLSWRLKRHTAKKRVKTPFLAIYFFSPKNHISKTVHPTEKVEKMFYRQNIPNTRFLAYQESSTRTRK